MIYFNRKGKIVHINVEHGIFGSSEYFQRDLDFTQEYIAELVINALQENLNRHLISLKRKYYEQGWKDAKAKKRKQDSFWGGWKS